MEVKNLINDGEKNGNRCKFSRNISGQVMPFKFTSLPEFLPKYFGTGRGGFCGTLARMREDQPKQRDGYEVF
jgi:hypothetical protein